MNEPKPDCNKYCPDFWNHEICGIMQRGWCNDPVYNTWVRKELGWDKYDLDSKSEFTTNSEESDGNG